MSLVGITGEHGRARVTIINRMDSRMCDITLNGQRGVENNWKQEVLNYLSKADLTEPGPSAPPPPNVETAVKNTQPIGNKIKWGR